MQGQRKTRDGADGVGDLLVQAPAHAALKGMFFNFVLDVGTRAGVKLAPKPFIAFKSYPVSAYNELVATCAERVFPKLDARSAHRRIGHHVYPAFAQTVIGSALFALAGHEFRRVIDIAPRAYQLVLQPGSVQVTVTSNGHAIVRLREIWSLVNTVHPGIWDGCMERCGVTGRVDVTPISACDADFELHWDA